MKIYQVVPTVAVIIIDVITVALGYYLAYFWRADGTQLYLWPWHTYWATAWPFIALYPILFAIMGIYPPTRSRKEWENIPKLLIGSLGMWALFVIWLFFIRTEITISISRLVVIYIFLATTSCVLLGRWIYWYIYKLLGVLGLTKINIFLVTHNSTVAKNVEVALYQQPQIYNIQDAASDIMPETIRRLARNKRLDEIVILNPHFPDSKIFQLLKIAIPLGISVKAIPNVLESLTPVVDTHTIPTTPLVEFKTTPLFGWGSFIKRVADIISTAIALVILSPVYLVVGILIKIDSRGPVFYRHRRLGLNGKTIKIFKFRTMKIEFCRGDDYGGAKAEEAFRKLMENPKFRTEFEASFKVKKDPRVTRIGHFLRKTSLDELPQFINVFLGQLSLVGPRPIIKDEVDRYDGTEYFLWSVKPGLSGLWQVSGRSDLSYEERVKLDLFYIESWSPWLDFVITVKTIVQIFIGKGAY